MRELSSERPFVEDLAVIRAEPQLTRPMSWGWQPVNWPPGLPAERIDTVTLSGEWTGDYAGTPIFLTVNVLPSRQRFGGRRWWWQCPECGRRCGALLNVSPDQPWACRRCWGAVYRSDYPAQQKWHEIRQWFGIEPGGFLDQQHELDFLTAPRRKGVRRGRRVWLRALRLLRKLRHDLGQEGTLEAMATRRPLIAVGRK